MGQVNVRSVLISAASAALILTPVTDVKLVFIYLQETALSVRTSSLVVDYATQLIACNAEVVSI